MRTPVDFPASAPAAPQAGGWAVQEFDAVDSTNRRAAESAPWSAITSRIQTSGRGRHDRRWVSDSGGLWLSAVVPTPGEGEVWSLLPLAAGLAVCDALTMFGVTGHRLRWPNDIMIGPAKLAGILVERFRPATAVVGIGINYDNRPETSDPALTGAVARLTDLLPVAPARDVLRDAVLASLRHSHALLAADRAPELVAQLSPYWRRIPVRVTLRPDGAQLDGRFTGVDATGRLLLESAHPVLHSLAPHEVELLRELSPIELNPTHPPLS